MIRVLMVCLGNICRSPLAHGILESKVEESKIFVDSAGTSGYHAGELPDSRSIAVAKKNNIDITNQRSRKFVSDDFDNFDLIYVMDESNYHNVISLAKNKEQRDKVHLILNELYPFENKEVPDPYYGGKSGFDNVFEMLDKSCEIIASKLNTYE
ncbi:low molecular weight protein-tyrosine-phosphatase [Aureivirga marina]|uniref:low molecular weight protein-tyrosine-phosphatase n=1 Tax=Aureivirga marina TaxID=1182451 RepID=UPI0018CBA404|nr:low molecular weight protein-tyrosine-phosphatase [Aureivirga marina]